MNRENEFVVENFNEESFWDKVIKFCKDIGKDGIEQVFRLYYALDSEKCGTKEKTIIYGALAYLVSPIDLIPDLTPVLGYTDDLALIASALIAVANCIDDKVKAKAAAKVKDLFD
ncbi:MULTISPECIES: YkvA family protein [unclassified Shewanella]|uniref:YkvA family protein n=1 Tax=unclassified Shewanella TaxID=196818 RepID=UPI0039B38BBC